MTTKTAILYARVSDPRQAGEDKVSVEQQMDEMREQCQRQGLQIRKELIDKENYRATTEPELGTIVNPSAERADRPKLIEALDDVSSGQVDVLMCWRYDRLSRHPRVGVVVSDALEAAQINREKPTVIMEATGNVIEGMMQDFKSIIGREDNRRRVERVRLGKEGTLSQNRWPVKFTKLGYTAHREEGKRGYTITIGGEDDVHVIQLIFELYEKGMKPREIRKHLIESGFIQKKPTKNRWSTTIIWRILRDRTYMGEATWRFKDGKTFTITFPPIIARDQFDHVQKRLDDGPVFSPRNTKGIYLCQGLLRCGECGRKLGISRLNFRYRRMADGTLKRYPIAEPVHQYRCSGGQHFPDEHARPYTFEGHAFDWAVWRKVVDVGICNPQIIFEQVQARQMELLKQSANVDAEITKAASKISEIQSQRAFFQRQAARHTISEQELEDRMRETQDELSFWESERIRLRELRNTAVQSQESLNYANELLQMLKTVLPKIDQSPSTLKMLSVEKRAEVLTTRQKIIRALCDKIVVFANGKVRIDGLLDGSEGVQFGLQDTCSP